MTYLIAGNGPAACHAAMAIRENDTDARILMVSLENNPPYSRITVPELLSGEAVRENIWFLGEDFYERFSIETRLGRSVEKIEPSSHLAKLDDGEEIRYDKLLLATGSRPFLPDWARKQRPGVHTLWNLADAEAVAADISPGCRAVIVGGGLVGLQGARALTALECHVTIVEFMNRLMPQQLDETASAMLRKAAESAGVNVIVSASVESLVTSKGRAAGVKLADGQKISADLVLVCAGVRPNLGMLDGIPCERGVEVDANMRTALPDVFAAGDVTIAPLFPSRQENASRAIWPNAVEQGRIAGLAMAGGIVDYDGARSMNSIELFGLPVVSAGEFVAGDGLTETILCYPASGCYLKILTAADGCLAGFLAAGEIREAGVLLAKLGQPLRKNFWGRLPLLDAELLRA